MGRFEKQALEGAKIKPYVWWRYLDDIFMIWTGNEDELREFIEYLNQGGGGEATSHTFS